MRKISSSGNPVIAPTLSNASADPPCASMTRFAVSTTNRTLSVSVPSRSQRTARSIGAFFSELSAAGDAASRVLASESRGRAPRQRVGGGQRGRVSSEREPRAAAGPAAPVRFSASPASARDRDRRLDRQRGLLGELAIARLLATAQQRLELVVERIRVLKTRIDDLESQIAHRI